jgi:multidrug resistance efflux pump
MKNIVKKLKNPNLVKLLFATFFAIIAFVLIIFIIKTQGRIRIPDSLVSAPLISLTSNTPGQLKKIYVSEGQHVSKGDPLALVGSETLYAFTNGVVSETNKALGATVNQQSSVIKLINLDDARIDGTIDENKGLNKIKVGQVVSFTVDALPGETFWGYIDEIGQSAKQTQTAFSISTERPTQQFDIYVRFDTKKYPEIKNGMSAKMTIYTKSL